jgi:type I restriction enzyme, S subunit
MNDFTQTEELNIRATGTTFLELGTQDLRDFPLFNPTPSEQRAVADFLDRETARLDALIAAKERWLELLAEKRRALITRAVTRGLNPAAPLRDSGSQWLVQIPAHWTLTREKFATTKIGSGKTPKGGAEIYASEGVPFIRSQNVLFEGLSLGEVVFISEETDSEMANSRVLPGDVLLNITGASIGRCCAVPKRFERGNVNQHVCILRPDESRITTEFLNAFLRSDVGQIQIFAGEEGISREGLSFEDAGNFAITLPPLHEQRAIVSYLSAETAKLDALRAATERTIDLLKERRAGLIAAAVTGRIEVARERQ